MPRTLVLKNVPDEIYERLRASAEAHSRSFNSEAIVCLELALVSARMTPDVALLPEQPAVYPQQSLRGTVRFREDVLEPVAVTDDWEAEGSA